MSFAPAQAIRLNNYSDQYGHLVELDEFVAPGQVGMVVLADGITSQTFKFEKPPNASQAAPTAGQICQITTMDLEDVGVNAPPLGPSSGLLLPIGLDSPKHLHHHANAHSHAHSATHVHDLSAASHFHVIPNHNHALGGPAAWTSTDNGTLAGSPHTHGLGGSGVDVTGNANGNTSTINFGNSAAAAPGTSDNATPGDSDLENVQHTHP